MRVKSFFLLIRVEHWVKNLFVFIPGFFAARLLDMVVLLRTGLAFGAFCLVASGVYIFNDIVDAPQDRAHPEKQHRPIAAGLISPRLGLLLAILFVVLGLGVGGWVHVHVAFLAAAYAVINLLYTLSLKHLAIVDVSIIGVGFLLRVFAGGVAAGVQASQWLVVLTFLLALILGLAKRRGEYVVATKGHAFRRALEGYNLPFLDVGITICATVAIVAYLMYCFSPEVTARIGSDQLFYTALFVIVGVLRYVQLTLVYNKTESPTRALLSDRFLQLVLLTWIGIFAWLLYK